MPYSSVPTGESHDLKDEFKVIARCGDYVRIASSSLKEFRKNSEGFWIKEPKLTAAQISEARKEIEKITDADKKAEAYLKLQKRVMYKNQRINRSIQDEKGSKYVPIGEPAGDVMCNLTALAMNFEYLGVSIEDFEKVVGIPINGMSFPDYLDAIKKVRKFDSRQSMKCWNDLADLVGVKHPKEAKIIESGKRTIIEEKGELPDLLRDGKAVSLSFAGHIVRLQNHTDAGLIVDDPYGLCNIIVREKNGGGGWKKSNSKTDSNSNYGEDNLWKWSDIKKVLIVWLTYFER